MKKFLAGCLVAAVLLSAIAGVVLYYAWGFVRPVVDTVTQVTAGVKQLGGLADIETDLATSGPFAAPVSDELTSAQLDRFLRVHTQVKTALGERAEAFTTKYRELSRTLPDGTVVVPTLPQLLGGLSDLSAVYLDAKRAQVAAMNGERFSRAEFSWVRMRVYQAAGLDAVRYDARDLEQLIKTMADGAQVSAPALQLPDVPAKNRALVKPHAAELAKWLGLAVFGL
ncbi:MAG: hypothetical protein ABI880_05075 [Acidobacteriota bacterium]